MKINCWDILGVSPTVDTRKIRKAYVRLLHQYHPEDDPEGFKSLRQAYEQALDDSRSLRAEELETENQNVTIQHERTSGVSEQDQPLPYNSEKKPVVSDVASVVNTFMHRVSKIYQDFNRRIDIEEWQQVLDDDVLWNLEVKQSINHHLFIAIANVGNIPGEVYGLFDLAFAWLDQELELAQLVSDEQAGRLFSNIAYRDWSLSYQGLQGLQTKQGDEFLWKRSVGLQSLKAGNIEQALEMLRAAGDILPKQPDNLLLLGISYVLVGDTQAAQVSFDALIDVAPEISDGYRQLAKLAYSRGDYSQALGLYQHALACAHDPILLRAIADCYLKLGDAYSAKPVYQQVGDELSFDIYTRTQLVLTNQMLLTGYRKQWESTPGDSLLIYKLAETLFELGEYEACIEFLQPLLSDQSGLGQLRIQMILGRAYSATDNIVEAEAAYHTALQLSKAAGENGYEVLVALSEHILEHGESEDALHYLQTAVKFNPQEANLHYMMGESVRRNGNHNVALVHYNQAIFLDSTVWYYFSCRAMVHASLKQYYEAVADLKSALEFNYQAGFLWSRLGDAYSELQDYDHAREAYARTPDANFHLGYLNLQLKEHDASVERFSEYIKEYPNDNSVNYAYRHRGKALEMLGRYDEAIADYNRALELGFSSYWMLLYRGTCYIELKNYDQARRDLQACIDEDPAQNDAYHELARIWLAQGDIVGGITYLSDNMNADACYLIRAGFYEDSGDFFAAAHDMMIYLRNDEHNAEVRMRMGTCMLQYSYKSGAMNIYPEVAKQNMEQARNDAVDQGLVELTSKIDYQLALCHCAKEEFSAAKQCLERVLEFDPRDMAAASLLADIDKKLVRIKTLVEDNEL